MKAFIVLPIVKMVSFAQKLLFPELRFKKCALLKWMSSRVYSLTELIDCLIVLPSSSIDRILQNSTLFLATDMAHNKSHIYEQTRRG